MFGLDVNPNNFPVHSEAMAKVASISSNVSCLARRTVSGRSTSGAIQIATTQTRQSSATESMSHFGIETISGSQHFR